jgi:hypothetical protein
MPSPTLTSTAGSTWGDIALPPETTATLTWNSADRVLVVGVTEDSGTVTLATPTASGLTFTALGSAQATASTCWVHVWQATAASGGSTTVSAAAGTGSSSNMRALQAWAFGNCTGFVRTSGATANSTQTVSVTRTQANSFVVFASGDWSATGTSGLGWTPAGQTQLQAANTANAGMYCAWWGDQGSTGTTSYGTTGLAGTKFTNCAVEILGSVGSAPLAPPPLIISQAVNRSYTY